MWHFAKKKIHKWRKSWKKEGIIYAAKPHAWAHRNEWEKNENVYLHFYPLCIIKKKSATLIIWHNNRYSPYAVFLVLLLSTWYLFLWTNQTHTRHFSFLLFFGLKFYQHYPFVHISFFRYVCIFMNDWTFFSEGRNQFSPWILFCVFCLKNLISL